MVTEPEMITISKREYTRLIRSEAWIIALESAGVDNWDGYEQAQEAMKEYENE